MSTRVEWKKITKEETSEYDHHDIVGLLSITPDLSADQMKKIAKIRGAGYVDDGADYAAIARLTKKEIVIESDRTWSEHHQSLIRQILAKIDDAEYVGPPLAR
jgi:hypothetical protein